MFYTDLFLPTIVWRVDYYHFTDKRRPKKIKQLALLLVITLKSQNVKRALDLFQ